MVDVSKIMAKWSRLKEAAREQIQDSSVAEERGPESRGGSKPQGSGKRKEGGVEPKAASKKRGQSKKGQLSSADGGSKRPRAGQQGKADKVASKSKSVGSVKQSGRKSKGSGNQSKKQSKEG